ncbi:flagellar protein FlhE [Halomonas shantousis]
MSFLRPACRTAATLGLVLMFGLTSAEGALAAAGSWVAQGKSVLLTTPGRLETSKALSPPTGGPARQGRITRIHWRYQAPTEAMSKLEAWLCHFDRCMTLPAGRGMSDALAGLPAQTPLTFRFRLHADNGQATHMRVKGLQIIVDYR